MSERLAIIDYGSGNLRSAAKACERAAGEAGLSIDVDVTADPKAVRSADRVLLPGVGAFRDCAEGLKAAALWDAVIHTATERAVPFLGICVGMQLLMHEGLEHGICKGFGWFDSVVAPIKPSDPALKIPHMGWNTLALQQEHPVLAGLATGDHAYFVHSFAASEPGANTLLASVDYGGPVTAIVGRDNIVGTQFHPEKSQRVGLKLLANFLGWTP